MPLYVRDPEIDALAERLKTLKRTTKAEAVRQALEHEIEREQGRAGLVELSREFAAKLAAKAVTPRDAVRSVP